MNKPFLRAKIELWSTASDFILYGVPWYMKLCWYFTNRAFYDLMVGRAKNGTIFARGIYDRFRNKIIICMEDLTQSTVESMLNRKTKTPFHLNFGIQFYLTLVHEFLHSANVAKDDVAGKGHIIDFDKFDCLPESLKDMFDSLLEMEQSNDAFTNHPENRRTRDKEEE